VPGVLAAEPIEFFDGMFLGKEEDRPADLKSVSALIELIGLLKIRRSLL
jgi:hypothetical protein